jgi:hypothetical protein
LSPSLTPSREPADRFHLLGLSELLLETLLLRDVHREAEEGIAALEKDSTGRDVHLHEDTVLLPMPENAEVPGGMASRRLAERVQEHGDLLRRTDVPDRHPEKLGAGTAVVAHRRFVHDQEGQGVGAEQVHRVGVALE